MAGTLETSHCACHLAPVVALARLGAPVKAVRSTSSPLLAAWQRAVQPLILDRHQAKSKQIAVLSPYAIRTSPAFTAGHARGPSSPSSGPFARGTGLRVHLRPSPRPRSTRRNSPKPVTGPSF
ncbi:hypothetical protein NL676_005401 [Syzygium grande]|nr:hypothetical protein NL676_005401 [Syzygium grande]